MGKRRLMESFEFFNESTVHWEPKMGVAESIHYFLIQIEIPGVDPENIDLNLENGCLYVSGSRIAHREITNDNDNTHIRERHISNFNKSIKLGPMVDRNGITAKLLNGILNINIPKREPPQKIDIIVE